MTANEKQRKKTKRGETGKKKKQATQASMGRVKKNPRVRGKRHHDKRDDRVTEKAKK